MFPIPNNAGEIHKIRREDWNRRRSWLQCLDAGSIGASSFLQVDHQAQRREWLDYRFSIEAENLDTSIMLTVRLKGSDVNFSHGLIVLEDCQGVVGQIVIDGRVVPEKAGHLRRLTEQINCAVDQVASQFEHHAAAIPCQLPAILR